ncbi:hypothetical protein PIB30_023685 [Stylosanthes scabra]|uniref:Uncharacterized protein n=1 Tax=Stylosanthes scabra TaxID=79078 RepID=A0ABU6T998_9FABA|nr:hypothetical protein [Stylosanthes scabra]
MWARVLENEENESETVRYGRAVVLADGKRKNGELASFWGSHGLARRRLGFLLPQRLRPSTFGERKPSRFGGIDNPFEALPKKKCGFRGSFFVVRGDHLLQDVAYHIGYRTDNNSVGNCVKDFMQWYGRSMWQMVDELLGARPSLRGGGKKEYAAIKVRWLRDRVRHTPVNDKSDNMVSVRWLPLLADFNSCKKLSWGSVCTPYDVMDLSEVSKVTTRNPANSGGLIAAVE